MATHISYQKLTFRDHLIRILLFVGAVALIVYFMPREGKFRYHFQEGKPWKYGLLTAAFDFPIYKTDKQIEMEQDSALRRFHPYYKLDGGIGERQLEGLKRDYNNQLRSKLKSAEYRYLQQALGDIYKAGVVSNTDQNNLKQQQTLAIRVIDNNLSRVRQVSTLQTVREAYESILENAGSDESRKMLRSCNVNNYLTENLTFDTITSEKVKSDLMLGISITSGMVQAGERIVDRGEIITPQTYNILRSLEIVNQKRAGTPRQQGFTLLGQTLITLILLGAMMLFLYLFRPEMYVKTRNVQVILLMVTASVVLCSFISHFNLLSIYLFPFAMVPIVIRTFLDSRVAFFAHVITATICSFVAPFAFEFLLLQISIGVVTIFSLKDLTQRSQLVKSAILIFLIYCLIYVSYILVTEGSWLKMNPTMFLYFGGNTLMLLFAYLLIFLLEKTLGFTSNVTLVELSNINAPLLRRLSEECPGTFNHANQVSNLAAQAAMSIGANAQLVRTGALYHDVGKLSNPSFYTENQSYENPHDLISMEQSIAIIKQHVTEGIRLAQKEKLPQEIIDFIPTHHGKSKLRYFYNRWINEHPGEVVDEEQFTYPGPNPSTSEQAIVMMADCVEAASKSMKEHSEESISKTVNELINTLMQEGMFNNTPLSFRDLEVIKGVFKERIQSMYHKRISYPERKVDSVSTEVPNS